MNKPLDEVLDIADKMQKRMHENIDRMITEAEKQGNPSPGYQDMVNTCLLMEIASIAYAVKQLQQAQKK